MNSISGGVLHVFDITKKARYDPGHPKGAGRPNFIVYGRIARCETDTFRRSI